MTRPPLSIGFVGPFPPTRSGIADYDSEIFSSLSRNPSLSLVSYEPRAAGDALNAGHDVLLLQIGNDPMHAPSVEALFAAERTTPAVVVLHEFVLHHLFAAAYLTRGREEDYARELERAHGARGRSFAASRSAGPLFPVWDLDPWAFPMSAGVIAAADAVVAHSLLVTGAVLTEVPGARAITIPQHVARATRTPAAEARRALELPLDRPIGITLGIVSPAKRIGKILEALALLPSARRPFFFVGGSVGEDDPLRAFVREHGLESDVRFGGYLSEEDFWKAASAATFAVNLRHPTMGETSHAVCRLAGLGLPLIVSRTGWFRELPDTFADKIPIGGDEVGELARSIERLSFEPEVARARGLAAASWAEPKNPDAIARAYVDVFEEVISGRSPSRAVSGRVALALEELGVARAGIHGATTRAADGALLSEVARRSEGILPDAAPTRIA
jgi:glycosyltransferase involved in cell wall biosynthesis